MDDPNDIDIRLNDPVENQIIADRKHSGLWRDLLAGLAQPWMAAKGPTPRDDLINQTVSGPRRVYGDMQPNLLQIDLRSRCKRDLPQD
jgi:hypothetical protein